MRCSSYTLEPLERKRLVVEFNKSYDRLCAIMDDCSNTEDPEEESIRSSMDSLWWKLDDIGMIQADPLSILSQGNSNIRMEGRMAVDEGEHVRLSGYIYNTATDERDKLDSLVDWKRFDLSDTGYYAEVAEFWGITRPQNMQVHEEFWLPRAIHLS